MREFDLIQKALAMKRRLADELDELKTQLQAAMSGAKAAIGGEGINDAKLIEIAANKLGFNRTIQFGYTHRGKFREFASLEANAWTWKLFRNGESNTNVPLNDGFLKIFNQLILDECNPLLEARVSGQEAQRKNHRALLAQVGEFNYKLSHIRRMRDRMNEVDCKLAYLETIIPKMTRDFLDGVEMFSCGTSRRLKV